jgi:choline-sulfatase
MRRLGAPARALALLLAVLACAGGCGRSRGPKRLNVLLIIVDTLRADHLRCYGYDEIQTPNIDGLAARGTRFQNVVTSAPVTAPSISGILTSTYPTLHGVRDNELFVLSDSLPRLPSVFRRAGYTTGAFVGSAVLDSRFGFSTGFDHYDDDMSAEFPVYSQAYATQVDRLQGTQRRAADVTRAALDWLEHGRNGRPFFCLVHYFDPHLYYDPPPPFDSMYLFSPYDGEIAYADAQIGALLKGLEKLGMDENTLVVFTSDHGEDLGQHGEGSHGFFLYDATLMVPLIISHPPELPSGAAVAEQARTVDIMPTILELAGLPVPGTAQGASLAQAVRGAARPASRPAYAETYHTLYSYNWHEMQAIRSHGWKYVRAPETELFDLRTDPGEVNNLASERPEVVEEMEAALAGMERDISEGPDVLRASRAAPDREMTRKMATLGYIGPTGRDERALPQPGGDRPDPKVKVREWNAIQKARGFLRTALALDNEGRLQGALRAIAAAESIAPDYAEVPATKGLIVKHTGDLDEAIELMESAMEMDADSEMAYQTLNNLGLTYLEKGECDEAVSALRRSLEIKRDYRGAMFNLGMAYERCGRPAEAADEYERYLRAGPGGDRGDETQLRAKIAKLRAAAGSN